MAEKDTPWVVRDVPGHTRRQVKIYAAEHDMTMARALEIIVDSVYYRHDRQLMNGLMNVFHRVVADDLEAAKREAEEVQKLLERAQEDEGQGD